MYEKKGLTSACEEFNKYNAGCYQFCAGCEAEVPSIDGECLCCDKTTKEAL